MGGWFNKEINAMADLKGLKMRIPGLGGEVLKRAGGTPVTLPGSDLLTALSSGNLDASEWVGPYNDLNFGLHKAAKYYYYPGWHEPGSILEFVVNKDSLAALPDDLQAIVRTASRAAIRPLVELARQRHVPVVLAAQGTVHRGEGWTLSSLHPGNGLEHLSVNDRSLVLHFRTECGAVLLPGDLERAGEQVLLEAVSDPGSLDADLLLAGHHGAANSSSLPFLAAVSPRIVLISAGRGNRFGHPDPGTEDRFLSSPATVASTHRDGLLSWRRDRSGWTLTGYTTGESAGRPARR